MIIRRIISMIIGTFLFSATLIYIGPITQTIVEKVWLKPKMLEPLASSQNSQIFQGTILQKAALSNKDALLIYGSSEFSAISEFHPSMLFKEKPTGFIPYLIGRGGCQDLIHILSTGAQGDTLKGKKVAIILSQQWFTQEGLSNSYFASNFSPLQAYRTLFNPSLSTQTKKQIAERLMQFPDELQGYPVLRRMLTTYAEQDLQSQGKYLLTYPIARAEMAVLQIQDAVSTVQILSELKIDEKDRTSTPKNTLPPWSELLQQANQKGKENVTNNSFGVMDSYYLKYIQPTIKTTHNANKYAKLNPSKEYKDLDLLLQVLTEGGAKALFVIVPVNGRWYDYTGFPIGERQNYYSRVKKTIEEKGFSVADFSANEYDFYFLQDIMHLGWKGWVKIDEALDHFVHQ